MSRKVFFRLEDDYAEKLERFAKEKGVGLGELAKELLKGFQNLRDNTLSASDILGNPVAGCATCPRLFYQKDEKLQRDCVKDGHFVVQMFQK